MSSIQERLQMKRVPLDTWNIREQLCLASAVVRSGDQNWMSVSRALKTIGEPNRPPDWYSQKSCAAQYGALLEHVETPKRKKRNSEGAVETPQESILKKLTQERIAEIQKNITEMNQLYDQLRAEIAEARNPATSEDRVREMWSNIENAKRAKERETARRAAWLKEREERRARAERGWRPSQPTTPTSPVPTPTQTGPPASPLLTSLLKSSPVVTTPQHIPHPCNVVDAVSPSVTAPTLSMLLEKASAATTTANHQHENRHAAIEHIKIQLQEIEHQLNVATTSGVPMVAPVPPAVTSGPQPAVDIDDIEIKAEDVYAFRDIDIHIPPVTQMHAKPNARAIEKTPVKKDETEIPTDVPMENASVIEQEENVAKVEPETIPAEEEMVYTEETEVAPEEPQVEEQRPESPVSNEEIPPPESETIKVSFPEVKFPTTEIKVIQDDQKIKEEIKEPESEETEPVTQEIEEVKQEENAVVEETQEEKLEVPEETAVKEEPLEPAEETKETSPQPEKLEVVEKQVDNALVEHRPEVDEVEKVLEIMHLPRPQDIPLPPDEPRDTRVVETPISEMVNQVDPPLPPEPEEVPQQQELQEEVKQEVEVEKEVVTEESYAEEVAEDKTLDEIKRDEEAEDSIPLKQMIKKELLERPPEETHTETDDDTPMELSREEEKDGKKKRDYSRKKKSESRTWSGSESAPESPGGSSADADRHHRLWRKSVLLVYSRLLAHKYASLFLRPISDEEAPGYSSVIRRPMDLSTIRRNIDNGTIRTTAEFQRDVLLMLSNALMYNSSEHSVYTMAKEMHEEAQNQLGMLLAAQAHAGLSAAPARRKRRRPDDNEHQRKRNH